MKTPFLAILLLVACNRQAAPSAGIPSAFIQGKAIKIVDGDTFDLRASTSSTLPNNPGDTLRIRLDGIDCPERNQPFGKEATQYLTDLISGQPLRITGHKKDRDGRLIGTIYVAEKINVNQSLVRDGYAWHFTQYSKDTTLAALEREARIRRVGLWSDAQAIAPWEWRKGKRAN